MDERLEEGIVLYPNEWCVDNLSSLTERGLFSSDSLPLEEENDEDEAEVASGFWLQSSFERPSSPSLRRAVSNFTE